MTPGLPLSACRVYCLLSEFIHNNVYSMGLIVWRQVPFLKPNCVYIIFYSFIHIRLLIITMTERIMYSERHAEYNKQNEQQKMMNVCLFDECQYTCYYHKVSEFRNELSIMGSRP